MARCPKHGAADERRTPPQGEEATVILLSTVRCNADGAIGFLRLPNRVNVMLSRAKHGMVVLGSAATLREGARRWGGALRECWLRRREGAHVARPAASGPARAMHVRAPVCSHRAQEPMWPTILDKLQEEGCLGTCLKVRTHAGPHGPARVTKAEASVPDRIPQTKCVRHGVETEIRELADWSGLVGDGGCTAPCGEALPCGHVCPRRCHADDLAHVHVSCTKPCQRLHVPCGHTCAKSCGEACGRCERPIAEPYVLPCGHAGQLGLPCWR